MSRPELLALYWRSGKEAKVTDPTYTLPAQDIHVDFDNSWGTA